MKIKINRKKQECKNLIKFKKVILIKPLGVEPNGFIMLIFNLKGGGEYVSNNSIDEFTENRIGMGQSSILIEKTEAEIYGDCKTEGDIELCRNIYKMITEKRINSDFTKILGKSYLEKGYPLSDFIISLYDHSIITEKYKVATEEDKAEFVKKKLICNNYNK